MKARKHNYTGFKILTKIIAFALVFVLALSYISYVLRPLFNESLGVMDFYSERENSLDAIYVGGSVCITSWAPYTAWNENGIASYPLGASNLYSFVVLPLVKEALLTQQPEVLLIDLRPFQYTDPDNTGILFEWCLGISNALRYTSLNRLNILNSAYRYATNKSASDTWSSFMFDIVRYHVNWEALDSAMFTYAIPGNTESSSKGFLLVDKYQAIRKSDCSGILDSAPVSQLAEKDLLEFLDYLKTKDQKSIFVVSPYVESESERRQYNYLANIIRDSGFDYLNFNDFYKELGIDESQDFYDNNHMNIFGAEKYTKFLSAYLSENYDLPDRREDASYSGWQKGYETWLQESNELKTTIHNLYLTYLNDLDDGGTA